MPQTKAAPRDSERARVRIVTMTPRMARQLLDRDAAVPKKGPSNRTLKSTSIRALTQAAERDELTLTWDAVAVNRDGVIRNGQHRLHMLVATGRSMPVLFVEGINDAAMDVGDRPTVRSNADSLYLRGETHVNELAALTRAMWRFERTGIMAGSYGGQTAGFPASGALAVLDAHPALREHVGVKPIPSLSPTQRNLLSYVLNYVDNDDAEAFLAVLKGEDTASTNDPRMRLREVYIREAASAATQRPPVALMAFAVKAWNAYRAGETIKKFVHTPGGSSPDRFPLVDGWDYSPTVLEAMGWKSSRRAV